MTTTQRPRPQRPPSSAPNPASRGVILVAVAVVVGVILLVKGGGVGFEPAADELEIATEDDTTAEPSEEVTTTTAEAGPATSVPPEALKVVALNGAGINGYAAMSQQFLGVAGYTQTTVGTAINQTPTTIVYFAPGFEADAATLAGLFGLDPAVAVQPLPTEGSLSGDPAEVPADVNVLVLLGPDVQTTIEGAAAAEEAPQETATTVAETG